jgi:anti-anti-sigma factor
MDAMVSAQASTYAAVRNCDAAPLVSRDGDRTVVWLDGEQDILTVSVLADTLASAVSADESNVIVDLSGVTFMSAATIGELLRSRNLLLSRSRNIALRSPSRCAERLLNVFGLAGLVEPAAREDRSR